MFGQTQFAPAPAQGVEWIGINESEAQARAWAGAKAAVELASDHAAGLHDWAPEWACDKGRCASKVWA